MSPDLEHDRFGIPDSAFDTALDGHGRDSPVFRVGMDVPMRAEVASLPMEDLRPLLIDWMWESPTELIPSNEQITNVIAMLRERPDANDDEVLALISTCEVYLQD